MTKEDFIDKVVGIGYMWSEHEHKGEQGIAIKREGSDKKIFMSNEGIEKQDWETIKYGIPNCTHMTRIVGYYSNVHNWNKSKLGELGDRRRGDYTVTGSFEPTNRLFKK